MLFVISIIKMLCLIIILYFYFPFFLVGKEILIYLLHITLPTKVGIFQDKGIPIILIILMSNSTKIESMPTKQNALSISRKQDTEKASCVLLVCVYDTIVF